MKTLDSYGFGGILADDMGLGKTVQVIALLLDEAQKNQASRFLIVCPASLVYNWENEINRFAPELKVQTVTGAAGERQEILAAAHAGNVGEKPQIYITSYDLLKRDLPFYEGISFRFQIIDEAQYIKNPSTQTARAVKMISSRTRFALTGTPIENRLSEFWSIFDYLMPGFLFSYGEFKKRFENPVAKDGDQTAVETLKRLTGAFLLRRLKKDVLKDLPEKLETVVYSRAETEQQTLYNAQALQLKRYLEDLDGDFGGSERLQILAQMTRLRQICCDPSLCFQKYRGGSAKLDTCMELISGGIEGGHKMLVFSQFTSMLEVIEKRLKKEGISYYLLTGGTSKEERIRMAGAFQTDSVPVFLISLKAGGTGLNLTAADMVIHYDPWWNAAAQNQATDRTHRIGQEKQVTVFQMIMKDTIEENIMKLQAQKKNLADQIISGVKAFPVLSYKRGAVEAAVIKQCLDRQKGEEAMALYDYTGALRQGRKQYQASVAKGEYPYLPVLDDILANADIVSEVNLGLIDVPLSKIVGTKTKGRTEAFAGNFMPLLGERQSLEPNGPEFMIIRLKRGFTIRFWHMNL